MSFAQQSPGYHDDLVLIDSTPVECARSVETVRRSALSDAAGYGYCRSHSRWFFGFRLHLVAAPDGTPRAAILAGADQKEREIALSLLPRALHGGELVIADKGYAGREFEQAFEQMGAHLLRPARKDEPANGLHLSGIRQRIEVDLLDLQRPADARTPRRPDPDQPQGPHRLTAPGARRGRLAQPPTRPPHPQPDRLHRLTSRGKLI